MKAEVATEKYSALYPRSSPPIQPQSNSDVANTGAGIAPEHHDLVFEEFRQVGQADKKAEGTRLGLALCRKFIELHGGQIWLEGARA
jgi:signal transduction histidine kinase